MRLIMEYVREMLRKAGLRPKVYYRSSFGWFDVFGIGRDKVVCDITCHPNLKRYEMLNFKCIVITNFNDSMGEKFFTTKENIHTIFLRIFKRSFPSYHEWLRSHHDRDMDAYGRTLTFMRDRFGETIARKLMEALVFLYTAGNALDSVEERVPYSALYKYLSDMGLIVKETKEIVKPKNFIVSPTLDGVRLAKVEIFERIDEDRIYKVARKFGFEKLFIAILGLSDRKGMHMMESEYDDYSDFYDLTGKLDLNTVLRVSRGKDPIEGFCSALCHTILYKDIVRFFKELMRIGLAFYYPVHNVYGTFLGRAYGMPREVVSLLSSMSFCDIEERFVERFKELVDMFYRKYGRGLEFEKAFELGVIERCEGGIKLGKNFENFARVRFAKLLSEFYEMLETL